MTIRPATETDASALVALTGQLGYPVGDREFSQRLNRLLQRPDSSVWVAEAFDGSMVGWIHAFIRPSLESESSTEIGGLIVSNTARRQGIGRLLVGRVLDWAEAQRTPIVTVRCNVVRGDGQAFYQALGFSPVKVQQVWRRSSRRSEPAARQSLP